MAKREGHDDEPGTTIPSLKDTGEDMSPEQKERRTQSPDAGYPAGQPQAYDGTPLGQRELEKDDVGFGRKPEGEDSGGTEGVPEGRGQTQVSADE